MKKTDTKVVIKTRKTSVKGESRRVQADPARERQDNLRRKNRVVLLLLIASVALFYLLSILKQL